jgi:hypothetical protein
MQPINLIKQLGSFSLLLLLSWILVHLLAIFGLFLAVALPIFQLVFFPKIICFSCHLKPSKHTPSHLVLNALLILLATFFSLAIVYLETKLISTYLPTEYSQKPAEFLIPAKNSYRLGEIFPMKIEIKGISVPINIVRADLQFDPTVIEIIGINTDDSFASIFIQKDINNELGYVRLTGGIPNPGWNEPSGVFGTIYLKGKKSGPVTLSYLPTSLILANDGKGTSVLLNLAQANYYISPDLLPPEQSKAQQEKLKIDPNILGEDSSKAAKLVFTGYAEPMPSLPAILGSHASLPTNLSAKADSPLNFLYRFNQLILTSWKLSFSSF